MTITDIAKFPGSSRTGESLAFALSASAAVFWGSNFEATRIALRDLPPWTAASGRFVIAAVAILAWMAVFERDGLRTVRQNAVAFIVLGVLGVAGFNAALFLGMRTSSPVTAAMIMGTVPLTTNLLESLIGRTCPRRPAMLGMAISLFGIALTVGAFSGTRLAQGDWLLIAGSVGWSLYTIGCRRWVHDASPLATSTWTMVFGALALLAAAFAFEAPVAALRAASMESCAAVVWMALLGSVLTYLFWQVGIAARGPAATSILLNLVPVAALVFAAAFGRFPHFGQIAGVAVAIFGVLLASERIPFPSRTARP